MPNSSGFSTALRAMRGQRPLRDVEVEQRPEVDVGEDVAGDHDETLVQLLTGVPHRARRAQRRLLGGVHHAHPELRSVPEVVADGVGHEGHRDHDVVEAVALAAGRRRAPSSACSPWGASAWAGSRSGGEAGCPSPPAMITAFIRASFHGVGRGPAQGAAGPARHVGERGDPRQGQTRHPGQPGHAPRTAPAIPPCRVPGGTPGRRT